MGKTSRPEPAASNIGLIGLGRMGAPMASRLLAGGHSLMVWNRSRDALDIAVAQGARMAGGVADLFARSDVILLVLANAGAADCVLGRRGNALGADVTGKLVIQLGTTLPDHSQALATAISTNGGRYIEAPVSGSRVPAEQGRLVAMLGGSSERDLAQAEAILSCFTSRQVRVGPPPQAMQLKIAVNAFLVPLVTALAEAWGIAEALGLDLPLVAQVLNDGPMASDVSRIKLDKLLARDWSAQASIDDVLMNARLIATVAKESGASSRLVGVCERLLLSAQESGGGSLDMVAVTDIGVYGAIARSGPSAK